MGLIRTCSRHHKRRSTASSGHQQPFSDDAGAKIRDEAVSSSPSPRSAPAAMTFLPRTWNEDLQLSLQRIALDQGRRPDDDICILVALVLRELPGWTRQHVADVVRRQPPTTPFSLHLLDDADHEPFAICRLHRNFSTRGATAYLEQISKETNIVFSPPQSRPRVMKLHERETAVPTLMGKQGDRARVGPGRITSSSYLVRGAC